MWGYEKCVENDRLDKKRIVGLKGCILLIYSCSNCRLSTIPPLFYMTKGTENGKSDGKIVSYQSFNSIRQEMNWQDSRTHLVRRLSREDSRALASENLTSLCQEKQFLSWPQNCCESSHFSTMAIWNSPQSSQNMREYSQERCVCLLSQSVLSSWRHAHFLSWPGQFDQPNPTVCISFTCNN